MTSNKERWDQIYTDKSPLEVSWYQKEPELSLRLIQDWLPGKEHAIIDVGGGASVLTDRLLNNGYSRLAVLDISSTALSYAKEQLGERAKSVEWFDTDVTTFVSPHRYSLWHDRAVFHFLTHSSERQKYIEVLLNTLNTNGILILAAFSFGGPTKCSGLDIVQYDTEKIARELGAQFELVEQADEIHRTPAGKDQLFSYYCFKRKIP
ncbi:MAG: class I SAM-dependent methyltransferase [Gammaproteobacteria bacterium]|nr:MAG: class I SAM-dependent methyltransferase [Gammaproteobacteria bacterium]